MSVQELRTAFESANQQWNTQMEDLRTAFATIEQGWANHQAKLQTVENVHAVTQGEFGSIKQEIMNTKAELQATIESTRNRLLEVNNNNTAVGDAVGALQNSGAMNAPTGVGANRKMDQLINPQNMVVETFGGKGQSQILHVEKENHDTARHLF